MIALKKCILSAYHILTMLLKVLVPVLSPAFVSYIILAVLLVGTCILGQNRLLCDYIMSSLQQSVTGPGALQN